MNSFLRIQRLVILIVCVGQLHATDAHESKARLELAAFLNSSAGRDLQLIPRLYIAFTRGGLRKFVEQSRLKYGYTGFVELDALNQKLGGYPFAYKKKRLTLGFDSDVSAQELLQHYFDLSGTGKWWNVYAVGQEKKPASRTALVYLTPEGTQLFQEYVISYDGAQRKGTGIRAFDSLNEQHRIAVVDTFSLGDTVGFTIESEYPLNESILDEYRELSFIEKVLS